MSVARRLEVAANISIILVGFVICWVVVSRFIVRAPTDQPVLPPGQKLALANVDWAANKRTLVFVLRKGCHLCDESAMFHRRLAQRAADRSIAVIALLPDQLSEGKEYVEALGLGIRDIRQADMRRLGIPRVPSVIIVDDHGAVQRAWIGKLLPREEHEVLRTIE